MSIKNYKRATTFEVLRYSMGGFGSNLGFGLLMFYVMFYFTDVALIAPAAVGVIILIAKIVDAIIDPFIGVIVDRTKSKYGKLRPWILFGAPLLAVNLFLIFFVPDFSPMGKIIYAGVVYVLYSFTSSFVNIPYHSLNAVITEDPNQRTFAATAKQIMGIPAMLIVSAAAIPLVQALGGGKIGWSKFALLISVLILVSFWICGSSAKRHDIPYDKEAAKGHKLTLKEQLSLLFGNKAALILASSGLIVMVASSTSSAVNMYFMSYNLNRLDLVPIFGLITTLVSLVAALFVPKIASIIGKKQLFIGGAILAAIPSVILAFTPYSNTLVIGILSVMVGAVGQVCGIAMWAMLPDCVEFGEWKTSVRGEATVTAGLSFGNQFGMAFGSLIAGLILGAVGYQAGQVQSEAVLNAILFMKSWFPALAFIVAAVLFKFYPITNQVYDNIIAEIHQRKQNTEV